MDCKGLYIDTSAHLGMLSLSKQALQKSNTLHNIENKIELNYKTCIIVELNHINTSVVPFYDEYIANSNEVSLFPIGGNDIFKCVQQMISKENNIDNDIINIAAKEFMKDIKCRIKHNDKNDKILYVMKQIEDNKSNLRRRSSLNKTYKVNICDE